jgi:hypothetical protein
MGFPARSPIKRVVEIDTAGTLWYLEEQSWDEDVQHSRPATDMHHTDKFF